MTPTSFWAAAFLPAAGDHLWQSTIVAVLAALVALALRRNHAHVRYCVWLAASLKFLIPFAPLVAIGGYLSWRDAVVVPAGDLALLMETVSEPFSRTVAAAGAGPQPSGADWIAALLPVLLAAWAMGAVAVCIAWFIRWHRVQTAVRGSERLRAGREVDLVRRLAPAHGVAPPPIVVSDTTLEPGVFGIVRPVLLWPRGLGDRLTDGQSEAILAHELCHLRRRDNLAAACHMAVQALFWFHPLVWWIGARLVDERERACDEEVLRHGNEPEIYAEGILTTCTSCIESRLACVAGVTGSNLRKRIEDIMTRPAAAPLSGGMRALVAGAAIASLAAPLALGAVNAPPPAAQAPADDQGVLAFEVASVKPNDGGQMRVMQRFLPGGGLEAFNVTLGGMIRLAYRLQDFQMAGEPEWVHVDRFDILARAPEGAQQNEIASRLQTLLADRFHLQAHMATRELPIYALTMARSNGAPGSGLRPSPVDCQALAAESLRTGAPPPLPAPGERPPCATTRRPGGISAGGVTMAQLAMMLAQFTGRMVLDDTGLAGGFDFDLDFVADPPQRGAGLGGGLPLLLLPEPADANGVSIFTALEEQLGLRLVSQTGPVEVLVIDDVERPTPD